MLEEVNTLHALPNKLSLSIAIAELSTSNCFKDLDLLVACGKVGCVPPESLKLTLEPSFAQGDDEAVFVVATFPAGRQ